MARKKTNVNSPKKGDPQGGYAEFSVEHLRERLALLKGVIPRRAVRKDLASVHFDVKPDGTATVSGTDLEIRLQLRVESLRCTGAGRVLVEAHALNMLLDTYAEPRVRLHLDDPKEVRLEGLQTKLVLPGSDPAKELKAEVEGCLVADGWMARGDNLVSAIERTRYAIDEGSTRYLLGGLALLFPEGDGPMEMVGCDGRRLSLVRLPVDRHGAPLALHRPARGGKVTEGWPQIRGKVVSTVLKLARQVGPGRIGIAVIEGDPIDLEKDHWKPGRVQVVTRDAVLTIGQSEGRYPMFRDVFPAGVAKVRVRIDDARKLGMLLANAVSGTDSEHKGVEITAAGGCIMMTTESETKGKGEFYLTGLEMDGKATFDLDALMFRQFFDSIGDSPVVLDWFGPKDAIVLHAGADHDFVIMPLTRDDGRAKPASAGEPTSEPEPEGDEPEGDGNVPDPAEPEPVAPVAEAPDAHEGNGRAEHRPGRNGRAR